MSDIADKEILAVYADPDVTIIEPDPDQTVADAEPGEDHVRWSIANWCAINYSEDFGSIGDGRGLHISVHTKNDVYIRTVTPDQLRAHAAHLIGLAERADARLAKEKA